MKSKIKYIQSLSQKKLRDEEGVFVAEGPKIVDELLQAPNVEAVQVFATRPWIQSRQQSQQARQENIVEVNEDELRRISYLQNPNQVLGIFRKPVFEPPVLHDQVSLLLDTIQDPGNLGTIIRCADWFGVQQIICSEDCVDVYNPKVVQATMGSMSRIQVIYQGLPGFIDAHASVPVYAATLQGTSITNHPLISKGFILIGNESRGIQPDLLSKVNCQITIPRKGNAESLNAAVATGILLSHVL